MGDVTATAIDRDALDTFERALRSALAHSDVDVTDTLERIGWRDFLDADPASAVPLVFGLLGELLLATTALDDVAFAALGGPGEQLRAAGHAFAHPGTSAVVVTSTAAGYQVDAFVIGGRRDVPIALVADDRVVSVAPAAFEWTPVVGIDPELGLVRVRGTVRADDVVVRDEVDAGAVAPACRRALAHELLGATDAMLASATRVRQAARAVRPAHRGVPGGEASPRRRVRRRARPPPR